MAPAMDHTPNERRWFWATLALSSMTIIALVFSVWELVESRFYRHVDYVTLHYLYISRGIASSLLLAFWAAWYVVRQRRRSEEELRRSWERYRGLLEVSPGAVALYDASLTVIEWNATAERLYDFSKTEVLGRPLPTVPAGGEQELSLFLERVKAGESIDDVETIRRNKQGDNIEVQLSLLPFHEPAGGSYFLEVTADIRERVRLRERLLEIEKLTSMGRMAAGTAHHLNTPLAAALLRVQMMREKFPSGPLAGDLERLESGIHFCQQFVQRLLEFSHRPRSEKQPREVGPIIQSVVSFLAPAMLSKHARLSLDLNGAGHERVLADGNLLETVFSIVLGNALDAIGHGGAISIFCGKSARGWVETRITDNGGGIAQADLVHVFEPFFTTKGPGKGTGLGLAIARNIALEHGGLIRLESTENRGTTVFLEFPPCKAAVGRSAVRP